MAKTKSNRFKRLSERPVNMDTFVTEWPEVGLIDMDSPLDPKPSIKVEKGIVEEMDGKKRKDFDLIEHFIANHAIDAANAPKFMRVSSRKLAQLLVDFRIRRERIVRIFGALTPAKLVQIVGCLNVVEMMASLQKMRARKSPANQAHVTNLTQNPVLLAADAAEAALRGFAEEETTVREPSCAAMNALSVLVGSQTGRGGVLTQCAVEEALNLRLGLLGLTTYSETLSVYGTERAFVDGDDTPWSKSFLASAYASRGIKIRFSSGTGSAVLMGHAEGKSMLYLEAKCLLCSKAAGAQGSQNGSISCIALPMSLPGGSRTVLAENLIATLLDLEVASGNDALSSHSDIRKSAKLMAQFLPGTDFICSGYSSIPKEDNLFGGGNFDAEDLDDYLVLQRDFLVNGGIRPVQEDEVIAVRRTAAKAMQAIFKELGFPEITEEEIEAASCAHRSQDMPQRNRLADIKASERILAENITGIDLVRALYKHGFTDTAKNIFEIEKQRISGDYLQTSAIFNGNFNVISAINDPNDYEGPGTGYRLDEATKNRIVNLPQAKNPKQITSWIPTGESKMKMRELGEAREGTDKNEVIVAIGPAFGTHLTETLVGLHHYDVLQEIIRGIEEQGAKARVIRVPETSDCAFIGHTGALLSGSGVAIGIQSKGTTVIHQKGLMPLNNLELLSQASNLTLPTYREAGRNAARYAKGERPTPIHVPIDNTARLRYIVKATLMHMEETRQVNSKLKPRDVQVQFLD